MLGFVLLSCLLLYAEGIQKARSDITAPHIIDATEEGVGDSPLLDVPKAKMEILKPAKKEEVSKTTDSSEAPSEVNSKFFSKKGEDDGEDSEDEDEEDGDDDAGAEDAEKKSNLKETTEVKKKSKVKAAITKSVKAKKKTIDDDKDDSTIADLSGAGSGETDTDMLSGDSRSVAESGDSDGDAEEEEEEEDADADSTHSRQNVQLHGDPEMVDIKPKEVKAQPNLNDFPDDDSKSSFASKSEDKDAPAKEDKEDADKKNSSPDDAELDDIKIEELLNPKKEDKKKTKKAGKAKSTAMQKGKISLVLQQNFNVLYEKLDSPSYQMLAGNIKKDIEKMVPGTGVSDVNFSEVSVEGNPRQSGKTKANFNIKAPSNDWMKELLKLVDGGDIDGLRVIKGSLEIEEE